MMIWSTRFFRAIHSVKGAAGFLGLTQINNVSHRLENVLGKVRDHQLVPDAFNVDVMLKTADRVRSLIEEIETSNETDNSELCNKLDALLSDAPADETDQSESDDSADVDSAPDDTVVEEATPEDAEPATKKPARKRKNDGQKKDRKKIT